MAPIETYTKENPRCKSWLHGCNNDLRKVPFSIDRGMSQVSSGQQAWSKEPIIALVTLFIMLFVFIFGLISRRRVKRLLASCCGSRQRPLALEGRHIAPQVWCLFKCNDFDRRRDRFCTRSDSSRCAKFHVEGWSNSKRNSHSSRLWQIVACSEPIMIWYSRRQSRRRLEHIFTSLVATLHKNLTIPKSLPFYMPYSERTSRLFSWFPRHDPQVHVTNILLRSTPLPLLTHWETCAGNNRIHILHLLNWVVDY